MNNRSRDKYTDLHKEEIRKSINQASSETKSSCPESLSITHGFRMSLILYMKEEWSLIQNC